MKIMKVYVVQSELTGMPSGDSHIQEVMTVRTTLKSAQEYAHTRSGGPLEWEEHDAHGPSWVARHNFRINKGPQLTSWFYITEHDLEDFR